MQSVGMPTFQQTFANCHFSEEVLAVLGTYPVSVRVNKTERAMLIQAVGQPVAQDLLEQAQSILAQAFRLNRAEIVIETPEPVQHPTPAPQTMDKPDDLFAQMEAMRRQVIRATQPNTGEKKNKVKQIYGKINTKKTPISMCDLTLDMGTVLVEGTVFNVEHKELPKRKAWVVSFDITDNTNSIRVTRFMEGEEAKPIVSAVKTGQRLQVQGRLNLNRYDSDMILEPYGINEVPKPESRKDTSEEKRIELHLHTKMSMMDALCDTKAVIKKAIEWGHPAIAITDHGVVQSFPDAYSASSRGEKIKVLYGVEAYFQNDVDERVAVHGIGNMSFDDEYIAFDIETTGLDSRTDSVIEIGAVRMRGGVVVDKFASFAYPGHPLSAKTVSLTNITDEMLRGAPKPEVAVDRFLDWAGNTPLVAHNAEFDTGFMREYCRKSGRSFDPLYFDTLLLAQYLCPSLSNHKLDTVASHLNLPPFQHHRAFDDAQVCGDIFWNLILHNSSSGSLTL